MTKATALFLVFLGCAPVSAKTLCAIGDSITYGFGVATAPPEALQTLLRRAPRDHDWRFARVRNFGVPGSGTREWLHGPPAALQCTKYLALPFVRLACDAGAPLYEGMLATGVACDGYLIMLGLADVLHPDLSVAESVDNLSTLALVLGAPTWIAAPTHVLNPTWQARRTELRNLLAYRGFLTGIDPPMLPLQQDATHVDDAGAAALAGLWYGHLR